MGVTLNGTGMGGGSDLFAMGNVSVKNQVMTGAQITRTTTRSGTKRRLNYNYRDVSSQLMRAKKPQGAATALSRAKSKVNTLKRMAATGNYDSREIANALAHAKRMVECAQSKMQNLKEEEREERKYNQKNRAEKQKVKGEVKRRVASKEQHLKEKVRIETIHKVQAKKTRRQQMLQKRRTHRREELGKINEADMKYLKGQMDAQRSGGYTQTDGVVYDLSAQAAMLSEAQMQLQAAEQAAEQMDGGYTSGSNVTGSTVTGSTVSSTPSTTSFVGGSVDISL
mgnify:CR=1 FL=1